MSKKRTVYWSPAVILWAVLLPVQAVFSADTSLAGRVKSSDGKPLEGAVVSARARDKTFTTTVYTNRDGEFVFPPLDPGAYKVWAQAIGFGEGIAEWKLPTGDKLEQNFSLKPLEDFSKQLSGSEWMASLPADMLEDRRMKAILHTNCTNCHPINFVFQNRFDRDGWSKIVDWMSRITLYGNIPARSAQDEGGEVSPTIVSYREELVGYLTKARGPNSVLTYKPLPPLTGESNDIVVTEYDIPPGDRPNYVTKYNGSIWSEGPPSIYEGAGNQDVVVDQAGNLWFGDSSPRVVARTLGKMDPRTGRVTGYKLTRPNGEAAIIYSGLEIDSKGNIWFPDGSERVLIKFDPKTEQFQRFPPPPPVTPIGGGMTQIDSKDRVWIRRDDGGVVRFDPETAQWTEYRLNRRSRQAYGVSVDANDNIWFAILEADQIGFLDHRTGILSLLTLPPLKSDFVTAKDYEIERRYWSSGNGVQGESSVPLTHKGPRRTSADRRGDSFWVAEFWGNRIAKININTKEIKEYLMPNPHYMPYDVRVDKNHMVWIAVNDADRILKFDPFTERFIEYRLPSVGTGARHIYVDNRTNPPTVWVPYYRTNRVARVQFRAAAAAPGR